MATSNMVDAICSQLQKNKRPNYLLPIDESGNFVIKRQSTSEITARDQLTSTGKRKAEPEARTLRKRHQTCEFDVDSESDSSWQSSEEEEDYEGEDDELEDNKS
ncbi:hypothetical protein BGZ79_002408 [Entomortierella chlamydospora]|nr:hypothetical protein BGZ79_002408 [Entomortierella chlamydospora]